MAGGDGAQIVIRSRTGCATDTEVLVRLPDGTEYPIPCRYLSVSVGVDRPHVTAVLEVYLGACDFEIPCQRVQVFDAAASRA